MVALQILALSVRVQVLVAQLKTISYLYIMNRLVVSLTLTCCLVFAAVPARAQYYSTGEDPSRLKWNRIQAGSLQVVYPRGLDSLAFRYAWLLEQAAPPVMSTLGSSAPSLPVIIRPYNVNSNGMVVWAPKRMELFTTPPSSGTMHNWEKQLVVHELRHVAQMHRAGEHFFRVFGWLFGQQSEGISVGLYFPKWLLEGDAVITETVHSYAGRGREASFLMPYKAYFAENKSFSYDKWRYGSFRHQIPDHYALGYMKLSVARLFSGEEALGRIFSDITKYPFWPVIYGQTFRKNYGYFAVKLWDPAAEYYKQLWEKSAALKDPFDPGSQINRPVKDYVSYTSPSLVVHEDGKEVLYAVKSSLSRTARLVRFPEQETGREETVCLLGHINSSLSASGPFLFWSERVSGHRWAHENFSVIMVYNAVTGKKNRLLSRTRYFNPSPSHDGRWLAAVYYPPEGGSELHLLNPYTGELLEKHRIPGGEQLTDIAWSDNNTLFLLLTGEEGTGICRLDRQKKEWETVLAPDFHSLTGLQEADGRLYFKSDCRDNTDNIFCLDPETGRIMQLTDARFGAFDPLPAGNDGGNYLYYANYTAQGYQLTRLHPDSLLWKPADFREPQEDPFILAPSPDFNIDTLRVPDRVSYPVRKFNKVLNAFRIHSWMPFYFNYDDIENFTFQKYYQTIAPGVTLMSQNTLGTLTSTAGYSYHKGFHAGHLRVDYSGLLPVISLKFDINDRFRTHTFLRNDGQDSRWVSDTTGTSYMEASLHAYIPFTFNGHGWQRGLVPSVRYRISNDSYGIPGTPAVPVSQTLQAGIQYYQVVNRAPRDIFPRLGFGLNVQTSFAPGTASLFTRILYLKAYGYLPGILRNQALKWNVGWQEQWIKDRYLYLGTFLAAPRGINTRILSPVTFSASLDYAIPLWAGDPSIPDIIYIKRFQLIPFADFMQTRQQDGTKTRYWSAGADLLMDFHLFRIGVMLTAGVRYAWTCENKHHVEFLFSFPAFN